MMYIVRKRAWFFLISAIALVICIASLSIFGLKLGIDFASGSELTVQFDTTPDKTEVEAVLVDLGYDPTIQVDDNDNFHIRTLQITTEEKISIKESLEAELGVLTEKGFENVDPLIARETVRIGIIAVAIASVCILLYLAYAFRRVPKPFHYGTCAVFALLHDIIIVLGVFSILGQVANWEIDLAMITGILTVIGYAVNDTIVIFDRVRENQRKYAGVDFGVVIDTSVTETISRSIITGIGVLFVLIALLIFVGPSIKNLVVVLMVGIYTGTYTSLFIAAPMLYSWEKRSWGSLFNRDTLNQTAIQ